VDACLNSGSWSSGIVVLQDLVHESGGAASYRTSGRAFSGVRMTEVLGACSSHTQGGSRMREGRTSGFVRGAHSNMCPYPILISPYLPGLCDPPGVTGIQTRQWLQTAMMK
jgi:hypothetical protein